jgi:hypothetical protein
MFPGEFMNSRMVIILSESERLALIELARQEMRYPRDQVRVILHRELERLGLLKSIQPPCVVDENIKQEA